MRLLCLNPNGSASTTKMIRETAGAWASQRPACSVVTQYLPGAPELLVTQEDSDAVGDRVHEWVDQLPALGFDAMVVACHGDPGLPFGRMDSPVPIVGIGWASMRAAASAARWGVVCISPEIVDEKAEQAARYGLGTPDTVVGANRDDYATGNPAALADLVAIVGAMTAGRVDSIVLGCTTMAPLAHAIHERTGATIIEPIAAGLDVAAGLGSRMPTADSSAS